MSICVDEPCASSRVAVSGVWLGAMAHVGFASPEGFVRTRDESMNGNTSTEWFVIRDRELLMVDADTKVLPRELPRVETLTEQVLGDYDGSRFRAAACGADTKAPPGYNWVGMRQLFGVLDDARLSLAGRAAQLLDWELNHAFCGRCGAQTTLFAKEGYRECPRCKSSLFPRLEPAVIVAIVRPPGELLLARSSRLPAGMHSVLAGFVEPGETLEQCVAREVLEETGILVTNITYVASQPWPFPRSLMLGFVAEYASGEIVIDPTELESADWFPLDRLPPIPSRISMARTLIDHVCERAKR
ncbi:MAG: NAD(+) diphosphatase [Polyangiaceae bacterium]